ncbi:MAG: alanine--glyoxylate aminotransferase family protein [Candidatus Thermoplasmatota archaeon]
MFDLQDNIFMLAGPVKIHRRVLEAMSVPSIAHRSEDFKEVNDELRELLKYLFQTDYDVALFSGSGTAGVEAAISNLVRKGDRVLNIANGKFGERLHEMSKIFATPTLLQIEWGKPPDLDVVERALAQEEYRAVTLCHNETSTGLTNQAMEIGALVKRHGALYILDGITSVGGLEVRPKDLGADVVIFGSQKCVGAPAGLAGICISPEAMSAMYDDTSYYLNVKKHVRKLKEGDTPWTPAIPLFLAMREALRMLKEEGIESRIARTKALAEATRAAVDALGLTLFPDPRHASNTLTAINYPKGIKDKEFRGTLRDRYGVIVAGAQDHIKGKVFRIGHMGICAFSDLLATFGGIEATLHRLGYRFERGASLAEIVERM